MPLPIRRVTPQKQPLRAGSRLLRGQPYNSGGLAPTVTVGVQKRRPTRPASDWNQGIGVAQTNPTGAQWIQAPPYNSGGSVPILNRAVQKRPLPTRPSSDETQQWRVAPYLLSLPAVGAATQR